MDMNAFCVVLIKLIVTKSKPKTLHRHFAMYHWSISYFLLFSVASNVSHCFAVEFFGRLPLPAIHCLMPLGCCGGSSVTHRFPVRGHSLLQAPKVPSRSLRSVLVGISTLLILSHQVDCLYMQTNASKNTHAHTRARAHTHIQTLTHVYIIRYNIIIYCDCACKYTP